MSKVFDNDKIKLKALKYAEKNKIVNQKSIQAFIAGFNYRDVHNSESVLNYLVEIFNSNYNSWRTIADMGIIEEIDWKEGLEARDIAKRIEEILASTAEFNKTYKKHY